MQRQILKGPIVKTLMVLALPVMLTNMFQLLYSLADTFWLGNYVGAEGVAATTLAWPLVFFLISFASGMSIAGTTLVSQYTGMRNKGEVKRSAGQVFSLLSVFAVLLSLLGILITDWVLSMMGANEDVISKSSVYIKIIFSSMPFMFIIMTFASILRGWGDTVTPMIISAVSVGINLILDPLLIAGFMGFPAMGVTGAAIATLVARSSAAVVCIYLLFRGKKNLNITLADMKLKMSKVKQIFKIGIPASLGQSTVAFGFLVLMSFVAEFGTTALATYGIGNRIINIVFIVIGGMAMASVTMMGQNMGAGKIDRAGKILRQTILVTSGFLLVCSVLFYIFSNQLFGVFISDRDVIEEGKLFMFGHGLFIMGFGIFRSVQAAYEASGKTVPTMIMGMIRLWAFRLPLVFILAFTLGWGSGGLWLGMGLSNLLSAIIALAWASTGSWKEAVVEKKVPIPLGHQRP